MNLHLDLHQNKMPVLTCHRDQKVFHQKTGKVIHAVLALRAISWEHTQNIK